MGGAAAWEWSFALMPALRDQALKLISRIRNILAAAVGR